MSDVSSVTSGTTGAGGGNMIRLTGLASGLDVDALVKKMMTADQTKLDKANQAQQTTEWKQEAYQDIIKDIKDLQSSFFDSTSSDKNILSSTNFAPYTVSGVGTSTVDTSVATFTPGVGAKTGTYSISVAQLAKGAGVSNTVYAPSSQTTTKAALSTKLTDIVDSSLKTSINLTLNANGAAKDINVTLDNTSGNATLGDLINAINNQGSGSVKATYSELTGELDLNTSKTGSSTSMTIKSGSTASLSTILGFSAANSGGVTTANWTVSSTSTDTATGTIQKGQNANVTITPPGSSTGIPVTDESTNNFTIDGMTYTLSSEGTDITHPATTSVTVGQDTQKVYDKIKSFIDKYNTIVDEIQTKLTEKPDSDYKPLTDAQKAEMSSTQITAWETKAKTGILRNDDNLQKLLDNLTTAFTTAVNNTGLSIGRYGGNSIGIDTSEDYTTPGHIDIADPTALKTAISTNCDQILKMFTNVSTTPAPTASDGSTKYDSSTQEYQEDGIFTRFKTILEKNVGYANTTLNTAILTSYANKQYDFTLKGTGGKNTLPDQLYEEQLNIKKITSQMSTDQEKYYQQFSQLETIMDQLNAQQSQLSSMLGS